MLKLLWHISYVLTTTSTKRWVMARGRLCWPREVGEGVTGPSSVRTCYVNWATRSSASGSSTGEGLMPPAALATLLGGESGEMCQKPTSKSKTDVCVDSSNTY